MRRSRRRTAVAGRQRGAALLMAIAMAGLLTAIAVELISAVQDEVRLAEAFRDDIQARWAVQAPVAMVISALRTDEATYTGFNQAWAALEGEVRVGEARVRFRVQDESGKVNVNALAARVTSLRQGVDALLRRMFEEREVEPVLVDYLADWLDEDSEPRVPGGEGSYYRTLPRPHPVKNRPLDTLSELRLVRGFTPKVLRAVGLREREGLPDPQAADWLTVHSDGRINVNTADPFILRNLTEGVPQDFIDSLIERRSERPLEAVDELKMLPAIDDTLFNRISPLVKVQSRYFSVIAEARVGKHSKRLAAVLAKEKERVSVVYWRIY